MIRPLGDYVVVAVQKDSVKSIGGILLTGTPLMRTAVVLRVGPGRRKGHFREPMTVVPGDRVALPTQHTKHTSGKGQVWHLREAGYAGEALKELTRYGYAPEGFTEVAVLREVDFLGIIDRETREVSDHTGARVLCH